MPSTPKRPHICKLTVFLLSRGLINCTAWSPASASTTHSMCASMHLSVLSMCASSQPPSMNRRQRRQHLQPAGAPPAPPAQPATTFAPAEIAGITEDHAHEQFFFDKPTCQRLLQLLRDFERPLLLCTPALAVAAQEEALTYLLLDRDERFSFLHSFQHFDLATPKRVNGYDYDAVFMDPPFANLDLALLRRALATLAHPAHQAPLYIAYNERREEDLLHMFPEQNLVRLMPLGYCSVKPRTQRHIWLYGPAK